MIIIILITTLSTKVGRNFEIENKASLPQVRILLKKT